MHTIKQSVDGTAIEDVETAILQELNTYPGISLLLSGKSVAIAVGSRGIDRIDEIVKVLICFLKEYTQQIYIVPAMGSHGGANAENQKRILAHLGITEANMGVPIHSSMETVIITHTDDGIPVHMDANAQKADFTIPIGRITAHCGFHGNIESGLTKMCVIGLGKQHGADWCHEQGMENMSDNITKIGAAFLPSSNIPFCLDNMK
jgi:nickel-dependent lactate racemase